MDSNLKQKWVRALRSGKYTQATGALRTDDGFCCLGVLCDVYDSDKWIATGETINDEVFENWHYKTVNEFGNQYAGEVLPHDVMEFCDMGTASPEIFIPHGQNYKTLASINDDGATFTEIADLIETHL